MKRIYVMLIAVLITASVLAQEYGEIIYQTVIRIKSISSEGWDTTRSLQNTSRLYRSIEYLQCWTDTTREINFPISATRGNFNGLTGTTLLFNSTWTSPQWKAFTISGYRINETLDRSLANLNFNSALITNRKYELISKSPWLLNTNPWVNDTFWTALLRNSCLYFNHRQ